MMSTLKFLCEHPLHLLVEHHFLPHLSKVAGCSIELSDHGEEQMTPFGEVKLIFPLVCFISDLGSAP